MKPQQLRVEKGLFCGQAKSREKIQERVNQLAEVEALTRRVAPTDNGLTRQRYNEEQEHLEGLLALPAKLGADVRTNG